MVLFWLILMGLLKKKFQGSDPRSSNWYGSDDQDHGSDDPGHGSIDPDHGFDDPDHGSDDPGHESDDSD